MSPAWKTSVSFGFIYTNGWSVFLVGHLIGISNTTWPQQNYQFSVPQIRAFPNLPHLNKWHLSNWCSGQNPFHVFRDPTWFLLARLIPYLMVNSLNSASKTCLRSLLILAIAIIPGFHGLSLTLRPVYQLPTDFLAFSFFPTSFTFTPSTDLIHSVSRMGFLK